MSPLAQYPAGMSEKVCVSASTTSVSGPDTLTVTVPLLPRAVGTKVQPPDGFRAYTARRCGRWPFRAAACYRITAEVGLVSVAPARVNVGLATVRPAGPPGVVSGSAVWPQLWPPSLL